MSNTKRNHFVPQHYLKEFSQNGTIYRFDKNNNKILRFNGTNNICIEHDLYTLNKKITENDILFIKEIHKYNLEKTDEDILKIIVDILNDDFKNLSDILNLKIYPNINDIFTSDNMLRNQEDMCSMYEINFFIVRDLIIKQKSIDFLFDQKKVYENPKYYIYEKLYDMYIFMLNKKIEETIEIKMPEIDKISQNHVESYLFDLLFYTIFQIVRTSDFLHSFENDKKIQGIELKHKISQKNVLFLIIQFETIHWMVYFYKKGLKPILLKNLTNISFITSDKPVINVYGKLVENVMYNDMAFELYFPISKDLALLWSEKSCYENTKEIVLNEEDVYAYNKQLFDNADNYLFSNKQENIENLL